MHSINKKSVIQGTMILTISALLVKVLSALYRVPYQNMVGDIGYYVYQQVYPLYAIFLILVTQGFPVVLSKLYIETRRMGNVEAYVERLVSKVLLIVGLIGFFILLIGAPWIASVMGDEKLTQLIRLISPVYLLLPLLALLRGRFQSYQNMVPTAVSQVVEQLIRVGVILLAAFYINGSRGYSVYETAESAYMGAIIGGIVATIILWLFYRVETIPLKRNIILDNKLQMKIRKTFYVYVVSICTTSMLIVLFQLAESINLYKSLLMIYSDVEAKTIKGVYDRAWPLIQLGLVIATSLGLNLITAITEELNTEKRIKQIKSALKYTLMISLAASIGLIMIMKPTNLFLFMSNDGRTVLSILVLVIFFGSSVIVMSNILQGLGHMFVPVVVILSGFILKILLNPLFVQLYDIEGAAMLTIMLLVIMAITLYCFINFKIKTNSISFDTWWKVIVSVGIMAWVVFVVVQIGLYLGVDTRLQHALLAIIGASVGVVVFICTSLFIQVFSKEELDALPILKKFRRR